MVLTGWHGEASRPNLVLAAVKWPTVTRPRGKPKAAWGVNNQLRLPEIRLYRIEENDEPEYRDLPFVSETSEKTLRVLSGIILMCRDHCAEPDSLGS